MWKSIHLCRVFGAVCTHAGNTHEWVTSHIQMSHVTHVNESCHTYEWGMSHILKKKWVMSHIWMSHKCREFGAMCATCGVLGAHMNESSHECATSHIRIPHITHRNESCHTYKWVTTHIWMSQATNAGCRVCIRVTWLVHMCDMTRSFVWHDSFTAFVTWLVHSICDMTHTNAGCRVFGVVCATRKHVWVSHVTHVWVSHITHINESCQTYEWVMSHI